MIRLAFVHTLFSRLFTPGRDWTRLAAEALIGCSKAVLWMAAALEAYAVAQLFGATPIQ